MLQRASASTMIGLLLQIDIDYHAVKWPKITPHFCSYKQARLQTHVWCSPVQYSIFSPTEDHCTGFQCGSTSSSRWPPSFMPNQCPATVKVTGLCRPYATLELQNVISTCIDDVVRWMRSNRLHSYCKDRGSLVYIQSTPPSATRVTNPSGYRPSHASCRCPQPRHLHWRRCVN